MVNLKKVSPNSRKDIAFQMVVAMRDTINIAKKKGNKPTYENAIRLFHDFSPELYTDIVSSLPQRNISDEAKVYIAKAEALSQGEKKEIHALSILQEEIEEYK